MPPEHTRRPPLSIGGLPYEPGPSLGRDNRVYSMRAPRLDRTAQETIVIRLIRRIDSFVWLALLAASFHAAQASERGTPAEARAMVDRAIALFDSIGRDAALAAFNAPDPAFRDRDLYLFVIGPDGTVVGHALDPARLGLDARTVKDSAGNPYGQRLFEDATAGGVWIDYLRVDPETGEERPKSSWVRRHAGYIFGVGVYR